MDGIFAVFSHSMPEVERAPTFLSQRGPSPVRDVVEASVDATARKGRVAGRARDVLVRPVKEAFALIIPRYLSPAPAPNVKCDGWCVPTSAAARSVPRVVWALLLYCVYILTYMTYRYLYLRAGIPSRRGKTRMATPCPL